MPASYSNTFSWIRLLYLLLSGLKRCWQQKPVSFASVDYPLLVPQLPSAEPVNPFQHDYLNKKKKLTNQPKPAPEINKIQ